MENVHSKIYPALQKACYVKGFIIVVLFEYIFMQQKTYEDISLACISKNYNWDYFICRQDSYEMAEIFCLFTATGVHVKSWTQDRSTLYVHITRD